MDKKTFEELAASGILYLDGATGSNLIARGMPRGVCPEQWILENKEVLVNLQKEYVAAGSNIIYAPTFTSTRLKLEEYGLASRCEEINKELVALSKRAVAGSQTYIAADISMTGKQLSPMGNLDFEELLQVYKEQITFLAEAGVDLIVVETMMSLQETRAAVIAAKECCDLPIMASLTFESDGRTLYGTDARTAAIVLESLGVSAIGVNCSSGPEQMIPLIEAMASSTAIPIIAKPNAGLPMLGEDGNTVYSMNTDEFVAGMKKLIQAGASIVGGCCGTTPAFIQALVSETKNIKITKRARTGMRYLTSERKTVAFGLDDNFLIVGERINPTGKKKLQEQLRAGNLDMVIDFAEEQELCGAGILDINMGMSGIDEKTMMLRVLDELQTITSLPLSIDSSHVEVIEAALRRYPGRALINSISYEKVKFEQLLPIAKKYGAMFVLLPLSDEGLPKNLDEKKDIVHKIAQRAFELGMCKEDIVVDGLVTTVGANKTAALETLETIRYCKQNGYATTCGLSNISFGLPERSYVNTTFLTMAIHEGLTMAIANPSQELLVSAAFASDLLMNKEGSDIRYIYQMNLYKEKRENAEQATTGSLKEKVQPKSGAEHVREAVLKGNKKNIVTFTKQALQEGIQPKELLDVVLLPGINEVGEFFDKGKYFLPQLIASAEAMKLAIEYLEPLLLVDAGSQQMPTIVIATVEGDIHDIGKNLVALMLKNYGFRVIDLGKDVTKETIIQAALDNHAQVIALSALMTTTMQEMKNVISYAKEKKVDAKVIIGGAVITQEYADEIGADGYSKDAAEAVKVTKKILGLE